MTILDIQPTHYKTINRNWTGLPSCVRMLSLSTSMLYILEAHKGTSSNGNVWLIVSYASIIIHKFILFSTCFVCVFIQVTARTSENDIQLLLTYFIWCYPRCSIFIVHIIESWLLLSNVRSYNVFIFYGASEKKCDQTAIKCWNTVRKHSTHTHIYYQYIRSKNTRIMMCLLDNEPMSVHRVDLGFRFGVSRLTCCQYRV